jgi:hypothetical protein
VILRFANDPPAMLQPVEAKMTATDRALVVIALAVLAAAASLVVDYIIQDPALVALRLN